MALYLKEILPSLINPEKNWRIRLLYEWPAIIGSLHSKVRIEKITDNILFLGAYHSCWIQELSLLSPLLIKRINEKLDQPSIKEIRFKLVTFKKDFAQSMKKEVKKDKKIELTKEDENTLAKINDPILRQALTMFRMRCYQE